MDIIPNDETRVFWQRLDAAGELRDAWASRAREILTDADYELDAANVLLARELERTIEELTPKTLALPFAELLTHALGQVDWRAIAGAMLERVEVWSVGWFRDGTAPEAIPEAMEPEKFDTNADARAYLADVIETLDTDDEAQRATYADIAGELRMESGDYRETIDGFTYWINRE
ncbi:hypothetical protein FVF58_01165 [Paraburkholderia panacisoli]|uniref:Uncharacterized protein n=1 Tax=Paraburkholderia panacisoli TaxID=2603818 RepID=A0A5B0HL59_9BURK|nr:hypothetical protein [Paraburkholderia panacisoli]KAA1015991.1 hypothetical protein FVF58_01165 [Paraburkholderia panacisoli]